MKRKADDRYSVLQQPLSGTNYTREGAVWAQHLAKKEFANVGLSMLKTVMAGTSSFATHE